MENYKLHVFIDTNILEEDPFLQQKKKLELLVKKGKAEILLPDVVIDELTKHSIKKSQKAIKSIIDNIDTLRSLQITNIPDFNLSALTQDDIIRKYKNLQSSGLIKILSSDNIKISRIMNRYIRDQKPFAENKESFRDYSLFCICVDYVHNNHFSNSFFVSNNTTDFANKEKNDFHNDLKEESHGMKYVAKLKDFFSLPEVQEKMNEIQQEEKYEKLVEAWIKNNISKPTQRSNDSITKWAINNLEQSRYLYSLFGNKLYKSIENKIIDECMNAQPELFSFYYDSGYVDYEGIDRIEKIIAEDFTAVDDGSIAISGEISLSVEVSIYANNWCYDRDDDDDSRYICLSTGDVQMEYSFNLTIDNNEYDIVYNRERIISELGNEHYYE